MKIVSQSFGHTGLTIEMVEFEAPAKEQVSQVERDIKRHLAALNARQAVRPAKAAANYQENAA